MTLVLHIAAIWTAVSVPVALWLGTAIRRADEREVQS